jgi:hypothetical protein
MNRRCLIEIAGSALAGLHSHDVLPELLKSQPSPEWRLALPQPPNPVLKRGLA